MAKIDDILEKALEGEPLTREEAYLLYDEAPLQLLCSVADTLRRSAVRDPKVVTWQIDRNVNITNVCTISLLSLFCSELHISISSSDTSSGAGNLLNML